MGAILQLDAVAGACGDPAPIVLLDPQVLRTRGYPILGTFSAPLEWASLNVLR